MNTKLFELLGHKQKHKRAQHSFETQYLNEQNMTNHAPDALIGSLGNSRNYTPGVQNVPFSVAVCAVVVSVVTLLSHCCHICCNIVVTLL